MYPDDVDAASLKKIVHDVAQQELLPRFTRVTHTHKADGSIVTEADLAHHLNRHAAANHIEDHPQLAGVVPVLRFKPIEGDEGVTAGAVGRGCQKYTVIDA